MAKTGNTRTMMGGAPSVAQVDTVTPAGPVSADEFWVRLENADGEADTITVTADASPTVAEIVTALQAAAAAAKTAGTAPWDEVTASDETTHLEITADTAGVPFYCTAGVDGSTSASNTQASDTANSGPGVWSLAENWVDETIPVAGDDVEVDGLTRIYGEDWDAVAINSLTVTGSVQIGSFFHPLQLLFGDDKIVNWHGTGVAHLDLDEVTDLNVWRCGSSTRNDEYDLNVRGTNIARVNWLASRGRMALGGPDLTCEADEIVMMGGGTIWVDEGVTESNGSDPIQLLEVDRNGFIDSRAQADHLKSGGRSGGRIDYWGGAVQDVDVFRGKVNYAGTGGITGNLSAGSQGDIDFGLETAPITVADADAATGAKIRDPFGRVTWTDGIELPHCSAHEITLETAAGVELYPHPLGT